MLSFLKYSITLTLICNLIHPVLSLPHHKDGAQSVGASNTQPSHEQHIRESVQISIQAIITSTGTAVTHSIKSKQDLEEFHSQADLISNQIEITVARKSSHSIVLYLEKNLFVVTKNFVRKYYTANGEAVVRTADAQDVALANCYYNGRVVDYGNSLVSISLCHGLNGFIEFGDQVYLVEPVFNENDVQHILIDETYTEDADVKYDCATEPEKHHIRHGSHHKYGRHHDTLSNRRVARDIKLPAGSNSETRYIEVYAVMDNSIYERSGSVDAAVMRAINIMNYASGLYKMLNIYLALVGVEVWNDRNKIAYTYTSSDTIDPGILLKEFNEYRHFNINWNVTNDSGQLFSGEKFKDGLIGKGSTTAICTQTDSGGVTYDGDEARYVRAATTMSHELGHNLGMIHSNSDTYALQDCECSHTDDPTFTDCIMHSSAGPYKQSRRWSKCTQAKLEKDFKEGNLDICLKNIPETLQKVGNTPVCGNFFVEQGEECDCGHPADCDSICCNPSTCKLYSNATCATGSCCDSSTCTVRPQSYPCRKSVDSNCDLEETCDGKSEWCPADTHKRDGTACENQGSGYCFSGKCNTQNSQCKFIWGDTASKSDDVCFEQYNNRSNYYGNCGWSSRTDNFGESTVKKIYHSCQSEADKMCGLLHCQYDRGVVMERRIMNFPLILYPHSYGDSMCAVSSFDVGYKLYDPGQVPNGASCGDGRMCVDSRCTTIPDKPEHCDCNGKGTCNQFNECHCDIGWAPPNCKTKGLGGSLTSNPPVIAGPKISVIVGLVTFFCGIVPIVIIVGIVAFCRRQELKNLVQRFSNRYSDETPNAKTKDLNISIIEDRSPSNAVAVDNVTYNLGGSKANKQKPNDVKKQPLKPGNKTQAAKPSSKPDPNGNKKAAISTPVFQSSTNSSNQLRESVKLKPSRAAPPRPGGAYNKQMSYENITPASNSNGHSTPSVPSKPVTPAKPNTPVKPGIASKINQLASVHETVRTPNAPAKPVAALRPPTSTKPTFGTKPVPPSKPIPSAKPAAGGPMIPPKNRPNFR